MSDWRRRARALADNLATQGILTDPAWQLAFEHVPRHVFVPGYYSDDQTFIDGSDPAQRDEWMAGVYEDASLVTQYAPVPGVDLLISTSSSTRPSLMARMLHLLDVTDGHRVLEIGTGSGYNAALLCNRLGDDRVASIDIDPNLIQSARSRLATVGYRPFLVAGIGTNGIPERAPFDRIIATCAVPSIPPKWISQLTPSGLIVGDLRGEVSSSLVQLRKVDNETVQGSFHSASGHFMWLRARTDNPLRDGGVYETSINVDDPRYCITELDPALLDDPNLLFLIQWRVPNIQSLYHDERGWLHIRVRDGLTRVDASPRNGWYHVIDVGQAAWNTIEETAVWWLTHDRPTRSRFGLTAMASGEHRVWLDTPENIFHTMAAM